jgi:hypothetical protein
MLKIVAFTPETIKQQRIFFREFFSLKKSDQKKLLARNTPLFLQLYFSLISNSFSGLDLKNLFKSGENLSLSKFSRMLEQLKPLKLSS